MDRIRNQEKANSSVIHAATTKIAGVFNSGVPPTNRTTTRTPLSRTQPSEILPNPIAGVLRNLSQDRAEFHLGIRKCFKQHNHFSGAHKAMWMTEGFEETRGISQVMMLRTPKKITSIRNSTITSVGAYIDQLALVRTRRDGL
jgi:hypothetical protein